MTRIAMAERQTNQLTRNQRLVLDALAARPRPMSAYSILAELQEAGLRAPLQVYRALERLTAHGLVHRIESLNAFMACASGKGHSDATVVFTICESCGTVTERQDEAIGDRLGEICRAEGFRAHAKAVEIHGQCGRCAEAPTAG